jgi:hypothetical protein
MAGVVYGKLRFAFPPGVIAHHRLRRGGIGAHHGVSSRRRSGPLCLAVDAAVSVAFRDGLLCLC